MRPKILLSPGLPADPSSGRFPVELLPFAVAALVIVGWMVLTWLVVGSLARDLGCDCRRCV